MLRVIVIVLWSLHLISCVMLMLVVLLQSGRGSGVAGIFGGGSGESAFGVKTGTLLGKITGGVAAFFVISAVILAKLSGYSSVAGGDVVDDSDRPANVNEQPAGTPQPPAGQPDADPAKGPAEPPDTGAPKAPENDPKPAGWVPLPEDVWLV